MAYQHFYSRVPARLSLYLKTDEYDTFAKSEAINEEYINENLSKLCAYRPDKVELPYIKDGKFPTVYCMQPDKSGNGVIESAITYFAKDFTGERSSHMVQSLVLTEEEIRTISASHVNALLNPDMFLKSLDSFAFADRDSRANAKYPEVTYAICESDPATLLEEFDTEVIKRLIFALLRSFTSKARPIYIALNLPIEEASEAALSIINRIMAIFPPHMREKFSFVTYSSDFTKYGNFKLRFIPYSMIRSAGRKGYIFDMTKRIPDGVTDADYSTRAAEVEFLFSLIKNAEERKRFIKFYNDITDKNPAHKATANHTGFAGFTTLFRKASPLYDDMSVLRDDNAVYDAIGFYDKVRDVLEVEDRCRIVDVIGRYVGQKNPIPNNIFARVTKMYPSEPRECKDVILKLALELLHTDVMREKLFSFIKSNYLEEPDVIRYTIIEEVSRVYYGGFLQKQILAHFDSVFANENDACKFVIIDKLMLTIRTASLQAEIFQFIERHYSELSEKCKARIYETFYEMLPEADELSLVITKFVNKALAELEESPEKKAEVCSRVIEIVDEYEKRRKHSLSEMIFSVEGALSTVLKKKMVDEWYTRKIFTLYLSVNEEESILPLAGRIASLWKLSPNMPAAAEEIIYNELFEALDKKTKKTSLFDLIAFDRELCDNPEGTRYELFCKRIRIRKTFQVVTDKLSEFFETKHLPGSIGIVGDYIEEHKPLWYSVNARTVMSTVAAVKGIKESNFALTLKNILSIKNDDKIKAKVVKILFTLYGKDAERSYYSGEDKTLIAVLEVSRRYLEDGVVTLSKTFETLYNGRKNALDNENAGGKKKDLELASSAALWAMDTITELSLLISEASASLDEDKKEKPKKLYEVDFITEIKETLSLFTEKASKSALSKCEEKVSLLFNNDNERLAISEYIKALKKESFGLFGKKKKKQ